MRCPMMSVQVSGSYYFVSDWTLTSNVCALHAPGADALSSSLRPCTPVHRIKSDGKRRNLLARDMYHSYVCTIALMTHCALYVHIVWFTRSSTHIIRNTLLHGMRMPRPFLLQISLLGWMLGEYHPQQPHERTQICFQLVTEPVLVRIKTDPARDRITKLQ